ncbi:MAG: addiction module protein [Bacteroidota bacterium]
MNLTDVKQNIIELNSEERAELIHFIVDLMEGEVFYLSDAWKAEIEERERKLKQGLSIGKPAREVLAKYVKS